MIIFLLCVQYRTARLLHTAALRLRKHSKRLGSFGAWNRCLNHLLTLAESHIESVILAKFSEAVERCFFILPCILRDCSEFIPHCTVLFPVVTLIFSVSLQVATNPISIAVLRCEDRQTRKVLNMVRDLYALDRIWKDIGTYRNQDYIAPNKAKVSIWQSFVRRACCIALGRDPV